MTYMTLDLETGTQKKYKRLGHFRYNPIVAIGYATETATWSEYYTDKDFGLKIPTGTTLLIGHNIKYDLLYLWENPVLQEFLRNGGKIWDTQLAEYILSGQSHKFPALRDIAVNKYQQAPRTKEMEEYWDAGKDTTEIPRDLVEIDVIQDVLDTTAIWKKQTLCADKQKQLKLIQNQMDALLATASMEFNGLYVDLQTFQYNLKELLVEQSNIKNCLVEAVRPYWNGNLDLESPAQISQLFFGGSIKTVEKVPMQDANGDFIIYKTGKQAGEMRFKNETITTVIKGLGLTPYKKTPSGKAAVDDEVLQKIATRIDIPAGQIAKQLTNYRETTKLISTYYTNCQVLIDEQTGCVHPKFNHVQTDTGRLSSADPNVQNQPSGYAQVKDHFISRFRNGILLGGDFSQLEIVVQAGLSKDAQFIQDIRDGVDFHIKRLALKEQTDYGLLKYNYDQGDMGIKERRTQIKGFSFARAYGAGINKIAEQTGMQPDDIKTLIQLEEEEYPQLTRYNEYLKQLVNSNRGWYQSPTGRKYNFQLSEAPEWLRKKGVVANYRPTQIINFIVQGTATADIVLIMLGRLWREILKQKLEKHILLVNTVHDDILLDVDPAYLLIALQILKTVINPQAIRDMLKEEFDFNFPLDIHFQLKQGKSWGTLEDISDETYLHLIMERS